MRTQKEVALIDVLFLDGFKHERGSYTDRRQYYAPRRLLLPHCFGFALWRE